MISLIISWVNTTVDLFIDAGVKRRTNMGWRPNCSARRAMKNIALGDSPAVAVVAVVAVGLLGDKGVDADSSLVDAVVAAAG